MLFGLFNPPAQTHCLLSPFTFKDSMLRFTIAYGHETLLPTRRTTYVTVEVFPIRRYPLFKASTRVFREASSLFLIEEHKCPHGSGTQGSTSFHPIKGHDRRIPNMRLSMHPEQCEQQKAISGPGIKRCSSHLIVKLVSCMAGSFPYMAWRRALDLMECSPTSHVT